MRKKSRIGSIVWLGIGLVVFGVVLSAGYTDLRDYLSAGDWQATTATRPSDNTKTAFISYEYTVDGQTYIGQRAYFFQALTISRESEELKERYPVGSEFTIYYDPHQPDRAVIHKELQWLRLLWWGLVVSCLGSIALLFFGFRFRRQIFKTK